MSENTASGRTIDVFYLTTRRQKFLIAHAIELSYAMKKATNIRNVYFLAGRDGMNQVVEAKIKKILGNRAIFEAEPTDNYLNKLKRIASSDADLCIKIDEDCYMTAQSWVEMACASSQLGDNDLFMTGCITNGIPTCDLFLQNFAEPIRTFMEKNYFCTTTFYPINGANYSSLNHPSLKANWDADLFWYLVSNIKHPYQGIHPMRLRFDANVVLNHFILNNFEKTMLPKSLSIIHDVTKYPHYCPQFLMMIPERLMEVLNAKEFDFDGYDEVPLNLYRESKNMAMAIAQGIPILHTMFNWSQQYEYESALIDAIVTIVESRNHE